MPHPSLAAADRVDGLIERLELSDGPVAVERNGAVVPRASHAVTKLADGAEVEIMHFVGGGCG